MINCSGGVHCNENPNYVFLFWELRRLSPNFYIHVSVCDLYIPRIGSRIFLQKNRQIDHFIFWEHLFRIFGIVHLQCGCIVYNSFLHSCCIVTRYGIQFFLVRINSISVRFKYIARKWLGSCEQSADKLMAADKKLRILYKIHPMQKRQSPCYHLWYCKETKYVDKEPARTQLILF